MANIQIQPQRPQMDHTLLEALRNANAYRILELGNPAAHAADHHGIDLDQHEANNAERLLQGVTSELDGVLHIAAKLEKVDLVRAISARWRNAVDVAARNKRGQTALHCAAATGNVDMINLLIPLAGGHARKRQLLREQKENGETCLHEAVRSGNREDVQRLVEQDVSVYIRDGSLTLVEVHDKEGISPLYLATTLLQIEIVRCLTEGRGVYPTASYHGPGSKTALHAAVLLSKDLSEHLASWNNKELIGKADVHGSMPLHLLASTKDEIIMKLLLDLDSSAGYQADEDGFLPIHVAAANGSLGVVRLLSELRPSCSWSCNFLGQSILHIAVQKKRYRVVYYLWSEQKFSRIFNTRDADGNTALHLAVLQGNDSIFCQLIKNRELCLSFTNKEERTTLDLARLSIPAGIFFLKGPRRRIMNTLLLAGANYGICRRDHLATNVAKLDKEKESESIGKSAGLVAVCSVLILTTSFAVPFSVTNLYRNREKDMKRAGGYSIFVMSDALAFAFSAVAISCSTLAGFSFDDRRMRLAFLSAGAVTLCFAAVFIILVFTAGMYVTVGPVVHLDSFFVYFLLSIAYFCIITLLLPVMQSSIRHTRALRFRLGFCEWRRAVISRHLVIMVVTSMMLAVGFADVMLVEAVQSAKKMWDQAQAPINPF